MSALRYGELCIPAGQRTIFGITTDPPHAGCPGGETIPGLLGGWTCPCECHQPEPLP